MRSEGIPSTSAVKRRPYTCKRVSDRMTNCVRLEWVFTHPVSSPLLQGLRSSPHPAACPYSTVVGTQGNLTPFFFWLSTPSSTLPPSLSLVPQSTSPLSIQCSVSPSSASPSPTVSSNPLHSSMTSFQISLHLRPFFPRLTTH